MKSKPSMSEFQAMMLKKANNIKASEIDHQFLMDWKKEKQAFSVKELFYPFHFTILRLPLSIYN